MKRREFLGACGAALVWPLSAQAEQKVPNIGVLLIAGPEPMGRFYETMRERGYVEGRNVHYTVRSAGGVLGRLPELAAELVRAKVDVIIASLTPPAIAARNATRDIPVIMAPVGDPVGIGLISSLARPGGNVTGLSSTSAELGSKLLDVIHDALPTVKRLAVLGHADDPFSAVFAERIRHDAIETHLQSRAVLVHGADELDDAFATMVREQTDAVIILVNAPTRSVELALKHRIPAFSHHRSVAQAGALGSYSASFAERGGEIADYVEKILKGAKPADLPVQQPDIFELIVNLKTAKALDLTLPATLVNRADEVIE
jgi:putative ABC transport system substrate-binding protein